MNMSYIYIYILYLSILSVMLTGFYKFPCLLYVESKLYQFVSFHPGFSHQKPAHHYRLTSEVLAIEIILGNTNIILGHQIGDQHGIINRHQQGQHLRINARLRRTLMPHLFSGDCFDKHKCMNYIELYTLKQHVEQLDKHTHAHTHKQTKVRQRGGRSYESMVSDRGIPKPNMWSWKKHLITFPCLFLLEDSIHTLQSLHVSFFVPYLSTLFIWFQRPRHFIENTVIAVFITVAIGVTVGHAVGVTTVGYCGDKLCSWERTDGTEWADKTKCPLLNPKIGFTCIPRDQFLRVCFPSMLLFFFWGGGKGAMLMALCLGLLGSVTLL